MERLDSMNLTSKDVVLLALSLLLPFLHRPAASDGGLSKLAAPGLDTFAGNILLLAAHPDDECIFFAPTILALAALGRAAIHRILTFDIGGISGHPNYKSLPDGVQRLMASLPDVRLFALTTVPLPAKYLGILTPFLNKIILFGSQLPNLRVTLMARPIHGQIVLPRLQHL
ncbi:hypothetical protein B0H10DRAFT_2220644 [Mycena sp. CBHHK59/15]|nr:hypothetical protein B0H10DRAFT_2220644 [Mycena sp. CBHHK59/15]